MYYVYILRSIKYSSYYVGYTANLISRLNKHNSGYVKSTKARLPYEIVYTEAFATRVEAIRREKKIKSYKGGAEFKKLISVDGRAVNCTRL